GGIARPQPFPRDAASCREFTGKNKAAPAKATDAVRAGGNSLETGSGGKRPAARQPTESLILLQLQRDQFPAAKQKSVRELSRLRNPCPKRSRCWPAQLI